MFTRLVQPQFLHLSLSLVVDTPGSLGEGNSRGSVEEAGGCPEPVSMPTSVPRWKKSSEGLGTSHSLIPLPGSGDRQTGKWSLKEQILDSEVA